MRPKTLNRYDPDVAGPDDVIPRCAGNGPAGMLSDESLVRWEAKRQKAITEALRLLPRRVAVADYLAAHPGASLLEILREVTP